MASTITGSTVAATTVVVTAIAIAAGRLLFSRPLRCLSALNQSHKCRYNLAELGQFCRRAFGRLASASAIVGAAAGCRSAALAVAIRIVVAATTSTSAHWPGDERDLNNPIPRLAEGGKVCVLEVAAQRLRHLWPQVQLRLQGGQAQCYLSRRQVHAGTAAGGRRRIGRRRRSGTVGVCCGARCGGGRVVSAVIGAARIAIFRRVATQVTVVPEEASCRLSLHEVLRKRQRVPLAETECATEGGEEVREDARHLQQSGIRKVR